MSSIIPSGSSQVNNDSNIDISDIQEKKMQTMTDIVELQNIEKEYFTELEQGLANNSLTSENKDMIIHKINEISQMRINLYKNLGETYNFINKNISSTKDTLIEQSAAINIVENELNESKKKLKQLEEEKYNNLRLVEINRYYGERYSDHSYVMKIIIIICIPVLILTILFNKEILPKWLYTVLITIIIVYGFFVLGKKLLDMISRDNMNYQEYYWYFNTSNAPAINENITVATAATADPWASKSGLSTCLGQACCDIGYVYNSDPAINKCVSVVSSN